MSVVIRKASSRGHANHGWLDSFHTFSFADYYNPEQMGFSALRVINDDTVQPQGGFATHGHRNMEIVSYVISGALAHQDSTGGGGALHNGDVQVMSAGTGVRHSEYNGLTAEPVHFLQIWLLPAEKDVAPRYGQRNYPEDERRGKWRLVASPDGADGSLEIRQDARVYATLVDVGERAELSLMPGRKAWAQIATGAANLHGVALEAGDGAAIDDETALRLEGAAPNSQILLFDLP